MRIKQTLNEKVNSFEFSFDLFKNNYLELILKLFELDKVYFCIYGLNKKNTLLERVEECQIEKFQILKDNNHIQEIALEIDVNMVSHLLSIIGNELPEIAIWSRYSKWDLFIDMINGQTNFFTLHKVPIRDDICFYLDFNPYERNKVEIIFDISFNNSGNIKKEDLLQIVDGFN